MNKNTAEHLNKLLSRHEDVLSLVRNEQSVLVRGAYGIDSVRTKLIKVGNTYMADAIRATVIEAARDRKEAKVYGSYTLSHQRRDEQIATDLAWAELEAIVANVNKLRAEEYETYRIACEQGVAVPPVTED